MARIVLMARDMRGKDISWVSSLIHLHSLQEAWTRPLEKSILPNSLKVPTLGLRQVQTTLGQNKISQSPYQGTPADEEKQGDFVKLCSDDQRKRHQIFLHVKEHLIHKLDISETSEISRRTF